MLPAIGLMIAGYIIFRVIDILARPTEYSRAAKTALLLIGILLIIVCIILAADMVLSGLRFSPLQQFQR